MRLARLVLVLVGVVLALASLSFPEAIVACCIAGLVEGRFDHAAITALCTASTMARCASVRRSRHVIPVSHASGLDGASIASLLHMVY